MDLRQISNMQIEMDEQHGFQVNFEDRIQKYEQLNKDLVGFFGEIGEFANLVKKATIKLERPQEYTFDITDGEEAMREELVDSLIYLFRLAAILDMDLQDEILKKMQRNKARYAQLKRD